MQKGFVEEVPREGELLEEIDFELVREDYSFYPHTLVER
jgi:hypothetical protein